MSRWTKSNGDTNKTCDTCIKKKRPCIRFLRPMPKEDYVVGWAPLPDELRGESQPGDLVFGSQAGESSTDSDGRGYSLEARDPAFTWNLVASAASEGGLVGKVTSLSLRRALSFQP